MEKASRILFLIGGILSFVYAGLFLLFSIAFIVFSTPAVLGWLMEVIKESGSSISGDAATYSEIAIRASLIASAVAFIFCAGLSIANGILALSTRREPGKGKCICNIVFGLLSGNNVNAAGGFLGFFALKREEKEKVVEEAKLY